MRASLYHAHVVFLMVSRRSRYRMVLSSSFPTAMNTALIAHEFKSDSHFAAAVFYSTLVSVISVTLLIALLRVIYTGLYWLKAQDM